MHQNQKVLMDSLKLTVSIIITTTSLNNNSYQDSVKELIVIDKVNYAINLVILNVVLTFS